MAQCSVQTGMLFWKKPCGGVAVGHCGNCNRIVCHKHFLPQSDGPFLCPDCASRENDESADTTGALFGISLGAAAAAAGAAEGRETETGESGGSVSGTDSGGSSDSGGGDSGSSGD